MKVKSIISDSTLLLSSSLGINVEYSVSVLKFRITFKLEVLGRV